MIERMQKRLGAHGRVVTLPFHDDEVITLLEALRKKRRVLKKGESYQVVAAEYDKYYDEVTFLLDLRQAVAVGQEVVTG